MKYEPAQHLNKYSSEIEILMMPYSSMEPEDIEAEEIMFKAVADCIKQLSESEQDIIMAIFYDRITYEELTSVANVKAKSHAWKKTKTALQKLKEIMETHPDLQKYTKEK
jgi:DNA-directed RNA polymerase specialized sigma subunit